MKVSDILIEERRQGDFSCRGEISAQVENGNAIIQVGDVRRATL